MSVEGQTEERIVKGVLNPYFAGHDTILIPILVATKVDPSGRKVGRGGYVSYDRIKKELRALLGDASAACVTTMYDYYGLALTVPGRENPVGDTCYEKARYVEEKIAEDISNGRFVPYLQLHELEGLLFSSPDAIAKRFFEPGTREFDAAVRRLMRIRAEFKTPEEINDDPRTCPHQRITGIAPGYRKTQHGPVIAAEIGIDVLRTECPHFAEWIGRLLAA